MSTIFALSSGALPSAIAVVRMSGPLSGRCLRDLTRKKVLDPRKMFYANLYDSDKSLLDTAMAVYLPGPSTFTGEDTAEMFVHGSRAVVNRLAHRLTEFEGVRHAHRGEFTKRAFYNGKMDMSSVRGLRDLINSETDRQRRLAQRQMGAGPSVRAIRDQLADAVGRATLLIDFGEHVDSTLEDVRIRASSVLSSIRTLSRRARGAEMVQRGLKAVLVGRPNSGKSSILNRLAEREVAIVSETAGTTRDTLEVRLEVQGVPLLLTDTAGLRDTDCSIEKEGIRRAKQRVDGADVVLAIVDVRNAVEELQEVVKVLEEFDNDKVLIAVMNKADLRKGEEEPVVPSQFVSTVFTCAVEDGGVDTLWAELKRTVDEICPDESGPCLTETALLEEAEREVEEAVVQHDAALCAQHLQNALDIFGEISGTTVTETILDRLFAQFCIGK